MEYRDLQALFSQCRHNVQICGKDGSLLLSDFIHIGKERILDFSGKKGIASPYFQSYPHLAAKNNCLTLLGIKG